MDKVILRRRGLVFDWTRPLQVVGQGLGLVGVLALGVPLTGWPPSVDVWLLPAVLVVVAVVPIRALVADRDGVSVGQGRERRTIGWDDVTRIVVEGRGRTLTVGVRTSPASATPSRRRAGDERPFALAAEVTVAGRSAASVADRIRGVTSVPVVEAGETGRSSYRVRASRRSVLPMAVLAVPWTVAIGAVLLSAKVRVHPNAVIMCSILVLGGVLALVDLLTPKWILAATGGGLRFDGEFLGWDEIDAIVVGTGRDGTELLLRLVPGTPAARVAPEVRRTLRRVRLDPARLAAALPPDVAIDATFV